LTPRKNEVAYLISRVEQEIQRNRTVLGEAAMKEYEKALAIYRGKMKNAR